MTRSETAAPRLAIAQALAKGSCPVCSVLKQFMEELVEQLEPDQATSACKTHTWALAKSAPAEVVVASFLRTLDSRLSDAPSECGLCVKKHREESDRLAELVAEMQHRRIVEWFSRYGSLCLDHAEKLRKRVPEKLGSFIDQIVERNVAEVREELKAYREQVRQGHRAGGGLLGRAAEFLAGQRGL